MWRAKLCGDFGGEWRIALENEEARWFGKLVELSCGGTATMEEGLDGLMGLGLMADRYQVEVVQGPVEEAVLMLLTVESCGEVLAMSSGSGLLRVETASRELALREFDEFSRTTGFMKVGEEVLGRLLEDNGLRTEREELVFEGLLQWMKGAEGGEMRGSELLSKVRFPLMDGDYLKNLLREVSAGLAGLGELVREAMGLQSVGRDEWGRKQLKHLDKRAVVGRRVGVRWEEYVEYGGRRLKAIQGVWCVAVDTEHVYGGLEEGYIKVWNRSNLELQVVLTGHSGHVSALLFVRGLLVSTAGDLGIRVWDVATGNCEGVLEGHTKWVTSLALCGSRLLSGSHDGTLRVWEIEGGVSMWRCERTLAGHESGIWCVVAWGDWVACGCVDGGIVVRSSGTWALERTLRGHTLSTWCLAISGRRLISSSMDGTLRVWSTEAWECVQTVEVYPVDLRRFICSLAVCGTTLVGGTWSRNSAWGREVRVWDVDTLELVHIARQPAGANIMSLVCDGMEVWGAVGTEVVVWGRRQ